MNSNNKKSNGLMGDLESIKALLEEDDLDSVPEVLSQALNPTDVLEGNERDTESDHDFEDIPLLADTLSSFDPKTGLSTPLSVDSLESAETLELDDNSERMALDSAPTEHDDNPMSNVSLDALLGDEFHEATANVMQQARGLINQHATEWSPQQTDELAEALRVRIDDAVQQWIQLSLAAHAGELQQRLLNAVRSELAQHLDAFESTPG